MKSRRFVVPLIIACLLPGACRPGDSLGESWVLDTLPSGIPHVTNLGQPAWEASEAWTASVGLELGALDSPEPEVFGRVMFVEVDEGGFLYVLDSHDQEIRVFRPDGAFSHRFGRKGEGPGELRGAAGLNLAPDGRIWVWETSGRFSIFARDGTFVRTLPRRATGVAYPWRGAFLPNGEMVDWGYTRPEREGLREFESLQMHSPVRIGLGRATADTLTPISYVRAALPFASSLAMHQAGNGHVWFGHTDEYRIYERTLEGDTLLAISLLEAAAVPVTSSDVDSIFELVRSSGIVVDFEASDLSQYKPVLAGLTTDGEGHVFVFPHLVGQARGAVMDVFRETGQYLGRVSLPRVLEFNPPPIMRGGALYGLYLGDYGVPKVVRIDFERGAEGAAPDG